MPFKEGSCGARTRPRRIYHKDFFVNLCVCHSTWLFVVRLGLWYVDQRVPATRVRLVRTLAWARLGNLKFWKCDGEYDKE